MNGGKIDVLGAQFDLLGLRKADKRLQTAVNSPT